MKPSTLKHLRCPGKNGKCAGELALGAKTPQSSPDLRSGTIECRKCKSRYPIIAGVAILVTDVGGYLLEHVKGISRQAADSEIPSEHRKAYLAAKAEIEQEHIEDDLEAERVNALYVMNHYLRASGADWWKPSGGSAFSPEIDELVRKHWDQGPIKKIANEIRAMSKKSGKPPRLVELGCGVGGLYAALADQVDEYLGIDSSFASIALARHLALGAEHKGEVLLPADLLDGPVSRPSGLRGARSGDHPGADFIVCDVQQPPLKPGAWTHSAALNLIDMMEEPAQLPALQWDLLEAGGIAIQSCPYIWHPAIAARLRNRVPRKIQGSDQAVEWLYLQKGFKILKSIPHTPWLFFKHLRQLELYSVHVFFSTK